MIGPRSALRVHTAIRAHLVARRSAVALPKLLVYRWYDLQMLESEYIIDWLGELGRAVAATRT